jgi:hypothetical protein
MKVLLERILHVLHYRGHHANILVYQETDASKKTWPLSLASPFTFTRIGHLVHAASCFGSCH